MKLDFAKRQLIREALISAAIYGLVVGGAALWFLGCGCTYYSTSPPVLMCR